MTYVVEELSIEVSNRCLLSCLHCSSGSSPKPLKNELSRDEHFRCMREAKDLGATVLSLSGGDPIIVPGIEDYISYAVELGYDKILFYTTGIWRVDREMVKNQKPSDHGTGFSGIWGIRNLPMERQTQLLTNTNRGLVFIFSLHSHLPSVNDKIMNIDGAWESITKDIQFLVNRVHAEVHIHMVPMRPNMEHVGKMRELCNALGVAQLNLLRFVPQTRGLANADDLLNSIHQFTRFQQIADVVLEDNTTGTRIRVGCPADFRHAVEGTTIWNLGTGKRKPCHAGKDLILIRPDGYVHPCAAWKSLPTDSNVRTKSLADIWENDETFNAIRTFTEGGYKELEGPCAACVDIDTCMGGCPAQRLHAFGRSIEDLYFPERDPMCPRGA